eukprot:COSAG06_NODE_13228_length_1280_cov_1.499577_2_plen_248_part_00
MPSEPSVRTPSLAGSPSSDDSDGLVARRSPPCGCHSAVVNSPSGEPPESEPSGLRTSTRSAPSDAIWAPCRAADRPVATVPRQANGFGSPSATLGRAVDHIYIAYTKYGRIYVNADPMYYKIRPHLCNLLSGCTTSTWVHSPMISRSRIQTDLYVKTAMLERNAFAVTSLGGGMAGGQSDRGASTGRTLAPTDERGGASEPTIRSPSRAHRKLGKGNARKSLETDSPLKIHPASSISLICAAMISSM